MVARTRRVRVLIFALFDRHVAAKGAKGTAAKEKKALTSEEQAEAAQRLMNMLASSKGEADASARKSTVIVDSQDEATEGAPDATGSDEFSDLFQTHAAVAPVDKVILSASHVKDAVFTAFVKQVIWAAVAQYGGIFPFGTASQFMGSIL